MYMNLSAFLFLVQDAKFGFGGVKKGKKQNSSESFSDVSSFNSAKHNKAPRAKSGNIVSTVTQFCLTRYTQSFNKFSRKFPSLSIFG